MFQAKEENTPVILSLQGVFQQSILKADHTGALEEESRGSKILKKIELFDIGQGSP